MNPDEPLPARIQDVPCPQWFSDDDVARNTWQWSVKILRRMRVLTEADLLTLEMYCICYSDIRHLWEDLRKEGRVVYTSRMDSVGNEYVVSQTNPKATQYGNLHTQYRQYSGMLGFDPSSRPRLKTESGEDDDPLKDF
jgi:P27 family predicted phage terminase small subunit